MTLVEVPIILTSKFPCRREERLQAQIRHLTHTVEEKDEENDKLEARMSELEVRIGKLNCEKVELSNEIVTMQDEASGFNKIVKDKEIEIQQLKNDILHDQDELEDQREAMKQMQTIITEKGDVNQRLQETVNTIKNQLMNDKIFDQKFIVTKMNTLQVCEYYVSGMLQRLRNFVSSSNTSETDPKTGSSSSRFPP